MIAMALGVLLAGAPLVVFDYWLSNLIERQSLEDVGTSAKRAISLAETRVEHVRTALDSLAAAGVNSCTDAHVEAMKFAVFSSSPVKEIALVDGEGRNLCTQSSLMLGLRNVLTSEPLPNADGYIIETVRVGAGAPKVRLRRKLGPETGLAALVPAEFFVPQVSTQGGPMAARAIMLTAGGAVLGESGQRPPGDQPDALTSKLQSSKYGFTVVLTLPRAALDSTRDDLRWLGLFAKGAVAFILIGFAFLLPKRETNNPVAEIERALEAGEFVPYFQPIVDIRSGQLRGAEVLVRWRKPDGTLVLPGSFIPLAESSGLIFALTRVLMRRTIVEAGAAIGARPSLKISFNFAAQLFRDESIVKDVRNIFAGSPIDLSQVVLELTERDPIEDLTETRRVIAALQGIGVRIAIDDVGTGHSGLSYMLKLGVDIIKIDKMFVDAIGSDRNSTTIVETLVDLAHNMRMDVVAEGVENFEQVMHLRELGIRSAQGYVFAPPLPTSAFLQLIESLDPQSAAPVEGRVAGAARRYMTARTRFDAA